MSEKYGLTVMLCYQHHRDSKIGVHFDKKNELIIKRMAQEYYEANIGSRDDFRRDFIKSYL